MLWKGQQVRNNPTPNIPVQSVGHPANTIPTQTLTEKPLKCGAKVPLFRKHPVFPGRQDVAFTGRGFIPDYMSEHGMTTFPEANKTLLEGGFVNGREGMMPPGGATKPVQTGQAADSGAGGAGSFATLPAFKAKG
jgi:hypothetical protein